MAYRHPTRLSAATFYFALADKHWDNAWRLAMGALVSTGLGYVAARSGCTIAACVLFAGFVVFAGTAWLEMDKAKACRKRGDEELAGSEKATYGV